LAIFLHEVFGRLDLALPLIQPVGGDRRNHRNRLRLRLRP
jgi:hypothetical protein